MTETADRLVTRKEAAALLAVQPQTLARWAMTGRHLRVIKIGRAVRYKLGDVQELVAQGSPESATAGA